MRFIADSSLQIKIIFFLIIFLIGMLYLAIYNLIKSITGYFNTRTTLSMKTYYGSKTINADDVLHEVDAFINSIFSYYILMNIEINPNAPSYITDKEQNKITKEITILVTQYMSDDMMNKLALVYNKNALPAILAQRIYLIITNYCIEKNKMETTINTFENIP